MLTRGLIFRRFWERHSSWIFEYAATSYGMDLFRGSWRVQRALGIEVVSQQDLGPGNIVLVLNIHTGILPSFFEQFRPVKLSSGISIR